MTTESAPASAEGRSWAPELRGADVDPEAFGLLQMAVESSDLTLFSELSAYRGIRNHQWPYVRLTQRALAAVRPHHRSLPLDNDPGSAGQLHVLDSRPQERLAERNDRFETSWSDAEQYVERFGWEHYVEVNEHEA